MNGEKEYRVTVDSLREQYVYHVFADCAHDAEEEGIQLAHNDGLSIHGLVWASVEDLS